MSVELKRPALLVMNGVHAVSGSDAVIVGRCDKVGGGAELSNRKVLKSPFPYPGGKSRVADDVWRRFGDVDNYIEPFAGSLAVLLRRPAEHLANGYRTETVNDANHYIVNFWRSVQRDPEKVAYYADSPVLEADLHARHRWLVRSDESHGWRYQFSQDPDYYDAKIAGWWVWGQCCWIGSGWCDDGVDWNQSPLIGSKDGVHERPQLTDAFDIGRGVNASADVVKMPLLRGFPNAGGTGAGVTTANNSVCQCRREWLIDWMRRLSDRLRVVRTCYGHWSRICDSDSTLTRLGKTAVFLDPPYPARKADGSKSRDDSLYVNDKTQDLNELRDEVLAWCRKWGQDKQILVAVCGYEGDGYEALLSEGWNETAWETGGGYANQRRSGKGKSDNAKRERIWWSPAVSMNDGPSLFASVA